MASYFDSSRAFLQDCTGVKCRAMFLLYCYPPQGYGVCSSLESNIIQYNYHFLHFYNMSFRFVNKCCFYFPKLYKYDKYRVLTVEGERQILQYSRYLQKNEFLLTNGVVVLPGCSGSHSRPCRYAHNAYDQEMASHNERTQSAAKKTETNKKQSRHVKTYFCVAR